MFVYSPPLRVATALNGSVISSLMSVSDCWQVDNKHSHAVALPKRSHRVFNGALIYSSNARLPLSHVAHFIFYFLFFICRKLKSMRCIECVCMYRIRSPFEIPRWNNKMKPSLCRTIVLLSPSTDTKPAIIKGIEYHRFNDCSAGLNDGWGEKYEREGNKRGGKEGKGESWSFWTLRLPTETTHALPLSLDRNR